MFRSELEKSQSVRVGKRIRSSRERRNMSPEDLSRSLVPPRKTKHMCNIEAGLLTISSHELSRIAIVLEVPIGYLVGHDFLSDWMNDKPFVEAYFQMPQASRDKIRKTVLHLAGDNPIMFDKPESYS